MQALFLVFLAAAWLSELVLAVGLAQSAKARRGSLSLGLATGVAVLATALLISPPPFLFALCFMCVLMQLASGRAHPAPLQAGAQRWRAALPLLSGNIAVLIHSIMAHSHKPAALLAASAGLTLALALGVPVAMAVQDRLQVSLVPASLRGTPIVMLSAALAALGLMGLGPLLPW
jgi:hypothetical protein